MLTLIPLSALTRFFTNIQRGYQHFLIAATTLPPLFRRPKNTTPTSPPEARRQYPSATIHNPPKVYIMYVMRLSRKQPGNATESPAAKLDKKIIQKHRRQSLARKKQAKNTAF